MGEIRRGLQEAATVVSGQGEKRLSQDPEHDNNAAKFGRYSIYDRFEGKRSNIFRSCGDRHITVYCKRELSMFLSGSGGVGLAWG